MSKQKRSNNNKYKDILPTLEDFTSKENWDKFFTIRGTEDSFEWYAEWPNLKPPLLSQLSTLTSSNKEVQILIPGCGSSKLSENLYDEGFHGITNIDFSKVVISDMLRRNIRERPHMKWRVMDMTHMQFTDGTFDAVVDKGGLDALMEPKLGPKLATQYVSEVKRVTKSEGKFVCLTLAESHVLGLLFSKFRFGWKMSFHTIPDKQSDKRSLQTFMVVIEKDRPTMLHQITSMFDHSSLNCDINQARGLLEALEAENRIRSESSSGADILYSLDDLHLGVGGDLKELTPGRRLQLTLGEDGHSFFSYKAVLLDAQKQSEAFVFHCGIFIVPKTRSHEWLFSSEEGQWLVVESSKAARLIVVLLDSRHSGVSIDDIQKDLSPLVKGLAPGEIENGPQIPFMMASDGVKQRNIVHQVNSAKSGPIIVEDVIYENVDGPLSKDRPLEELTFRRLTFERSLGLVQSEAFLTREECSLNNVSEMNKRKTNSTAKSKKKVNQKRSSSSVPLVHESRNLMKVDHTYLASSYHAGIISGFMLVSSRLQNISSFGRMGKTVIIGLGAGLLPMFLRVCMPCLDVEVVELDSVVIRLARDYFGFIEDKQLKVHVSDGIEFVREVASVAASSTDSIKQDNSTSLSKEKYCPSKGYGSFVTEGKKNTRIDVLIIDVDSSDSSSGMSCPHPDFVDESFLVTVKESLSDEGLFVINLVSRSPAITEAVVSRIKAVFSSLFCLQLEEDVNMILFALPMEVRMTDDGLADAVSEFQKLLKLTDMESGQTGIIMDSTKKIKQLQ